MDFTGFLNGSGWIQPAIWAAAVAVIILLLRASNIFRYIPNNQVGIVEKLWSMSGSIDGGFIALNGEAGYEPEVLRGGVHVFFPFILRSRDGFRCTIAAPYIVDHIERYFDALARSSMRG